MSDPTPGAAGREPRVVTSPYRVIYGDTDQMGVVYYANYFALFERGRCELMRDAGISYGEVEAHGFILPVVDAQCRYKLPARFDDLLLLETRVVKVGRIKVEFAYRILRDDEGGRVVLAEGATTHGSLSKDLRPAKIPPEFADRLLFRS